MTLGASGIQKLTRIQAEEQAASLLSARDRARRIRSLVGQMFGEKPARYNAIRIAHVLSEQAPHLFAPFGEELAGLLAEAPLADWHTRCYLGLLVSRAADTAALRLRLAPLLALYAEDPRIAVRCTALEGMVRLAAAESRYREEAERLLAAARHGAPAERARARHMVPLLHALREGLSTR